MVASFFKQQAKYAFSALHPLLPATARTRLKEHFELRYWRDYYRAIDDASDGDRRDTLAHERSHYRHFYTDFFDLGADDYRDKRLLDIGCGPVGSLEWADMTRLRLGLDPLAHAYRGLDAQAQKMAYVAAASEAIPAAPASFDIVASFNSLDHVADIGRTATEIGRVTAPGGHFLLITEINHLPTPTEPHRLTEAVSDLFEADFETRSRRLFGVRDDHNLYGSLLDGIAYRPGESGLLCAHFIGALRSRPPASANKRNTPSLDSLTLFLKTAQLHKIARDFSHNRDEASIGSFTNLAYTFIMLRIVVIFVFVLVGIQQGFARGTIDLGQLDTAAIVHLDTAVAAALTEECCDETEVTEDRQFLLQGRLQGAASACGFKTAVIGARPCVGSSRQPGFDHAQRRPEAPQVLIFVS